ncbi:PEPxxWA-CTERM sorting domain-containing protein [Sandaracinobacter sp. RS1-74]|uniref:PEPxxWA-CTERM sorting domain-containing protein n=1 Tax=Sandaracinobacteroides sayramensis TaxID=2913411 RepID=UPI001EDA0E69|nr:PEPxxWA-CTERM sorting domain-containing protein [Sandaracinobacteroides sayramensis]MCG2842179.1 PEPxxWA-CTERM sorting domain-containing protein [Sandaracinobacteroides sayramensis]
MIRIIGAALLSTAAVASPAAALTITFDELSPGNKGRELAVDGFHFSLGGAPGFNEVDISFYINPLGHGYNADPEGLTVTQGRHGTAVTVTKIGGGAFDFVSIGLADSWNRGSAAGAELVYFRFNTAEGFSEEVVTIDGTPGLQTFTANRQGLLSFSFHTVWNRIQFDNVVIGDPVVPGTPGGVPEPATWAMLIAGFGLVGSAMRRRREAVSQAL